MTTSAHKKSDKKSVEAAAVAQTPAPAKAAALIAYYAIPAPQGKQPVLAPIGAAFAHDDGEGFTLQLHLVPTAGGQVILRVPKVKAAA